MLGLYIINMAIYALGGSVLYYAFASILLIMAEHTRIDLDGNCPTEDEYDSFYKGSFKVWCVLIAIFALVAIIAGFFIVPKMEMGQKLSWLIFK